MQFEFLLNLKSGKIETSDPNFFAATEFSRETLSEISGFALFPDREFYNSLTERFNEGSTKSIHFYNYLYTSDEKRIRVSGKAMRSAEGYIFSCRREKRKDATLTEVERKNSLLSAVNKSAELFLSQINWKRVIYKSLDLLSRAGDFPYIRVWRIVKESNNSLTLILKGSSSEEDHRRKKVLENVTPFDEFLPKLKRNETIINREPLKLIDGFHKSELFLPINIDRMIWGVVEIISVNQRLWEADEITALESYAKILASAIRSYSINKQLVDTQKKLELITETTQSVFYCRKNEAEEFDYLSPSHKNLTEMKDKSTSSEEIKKIAFGRKKSTLVESGKTKKVYRLITNGKEKFISDKKFKWLRNDGSVYGEIGIMQDVTEQRRHQVALLRNNKILNAVNNFTQMVLNKKDADANLDTLLKYLGEAIETDRVFLYKLNGKAGRFSLNAFWFNSKLPEDSTGIYELEFGKRELKRLTEKLKSGRILKSVKRISPEQSQSSLVIPIFKSDSLYAFLGFDEFKGKREWTRAEEDALGIAAKVIGASFELTDFITELVHTKKEAQKSDRLKTEFIAQISHEVRSPLNIIMSFLGMMWEEVRGSDTHNMTEIYDTIQQASQRLIRTIDLLIEASTIQSGTYNANFEKFDLIDEIIHPLYITSRPATEQKKLLLLRESNSVERTVLGDKKSLFSAIENLLGNAIKYTKKGYIKIIDYNEGANLVVEIEDTGKGISPEYLKKMYFPFTQENQGLDRSFEGLGLGMFLVKKYCEINEAELFVQSQVSEGTKFIIKIPLAGIRKENDTKERYL